MQGSAWLSSDGWGGSSSPCSWFGVLCCDDTGVITDATPPLPISCASPGAVLALSLPGNNLHGTIPGSLFTTVQTLVTFDFRGMQHVRVSSTSSCLVAAQSDWLAGNALEGTVPNELSPSNLPYLSGIFLDQNQLTGTIPATVFQFSSLLTLRMVSLCSTDRLDCSSVDLCKACKCQQFLNTSCFW